MKSGRASLSSLRYGALAACALAAAGCTSVVPSSTATAAWLPSKAAREDRKTAELAKHDPFPSPKDVGLEAAK